MAETFNAREWPVCCLGQATATADKLNVRAEPGTNGKVLGQLAAGQAVDVWAILNGWAVVQAASGLTGWSAVQYLKLRVVSAG